MKTLKLIQYSLLFLLLLASCSGVPSYTDKTVDKFNELKTPVVLLAKTNDAIGGYSVILIDANGEACYFGNNSTLANAIGDHYKVGDIVKQSLNSK